MSWMTSIKESWIKPVQKAPFPHAELETLEVVAGRTGIDLKMALPVLRAAGLIIDPSRTVKAIATENAMTPIAFSKKSPRSGRKRRSPQAEGPDQENPIFQKVAVRVKKQ